MRAESGAQFLDRIVANLKVESKNVGTVVRPGDVKSNEIMPVSGLCRPMTDENRWALLDVSRSRNAAGHLTDRLFWHDAIRMLFGRLVTDQT